MPTKISSCRCSFPAILALAGAALLTGCSSSVRRVEPPPEFQKAARELLELEEQYSQDQAAIRKIDAGLPAREQALIPLKKEAEQLTTRLQTLDKADETAYAQFSSLSVERESVKLEKKARDFIRDFPASHLAPDAKRLLSLAEVVVARGKEQKRQHDQEIEASELARKKLLDERFGRRELSLPELKSYLQGKTQDEVVVLLGKPSGASTVIWVYEGDYAIDATGKKRGIVIYFSGGRVTSVAPR
jgi:hypothetical protein